MGTLAQDLRYAVRLLRQKPGFSLIAILTLALGVGSTMAVFSVVDRVLIRPLPYPDSDRLVSVSTLLGSMQLDTLVSPEYVEWHRVNHVFQELAACSRNLSSGYLGVGGDSQKVAYTRVSANFFDTLSVQPKLGRGFLDGEARPGGRDVLILTDGLWRRAFAADPGVLGRGVTFDGKPFTIVGVMPPGFQFPAQGPLDALAPLPVPVDPDPDRREMRTWTAIGRLKPGVSFAQARAEFQQLFESTRQRYPVMYKRDTSLQFISLKEHQVRKVRLTLLVLLAAVGFVLLIACANVANLLLAKAVARQPELVIRSALGAGRFRIARQLLTESVLLAGVGGLAGAGIGVIAVRAIARFGPRSVPGIESVSIDFRMLGLAILLAFVTGLIFGLAPALGSAQRIRSSHRSLHGLLMTGELALSLILLIGAGLLIESLWRLQNQNMGFQRENVLTANLSLRNIPLSRRRELIAEVERLPGTISAGIADGLPPHGGGRSSTFSRSDRPLPKGWHRGDNVLVRRISPAYFGALGIPLLKGRLFTEADRAETNGVAIINQTLAKRYFAGEDPLGKRVDGVGGMRWKTIVGVVADARNRGLDQPPEAEICTPYDWSQADTVVDMVIRTAADPLAAVGSLRALLSVPATYRTMDQNLDELVSGPRFNTALFGSFAGIALLLALVGTYGVISYSVARRTREIGLRMAVGADRSDIVRMIAAEVLRLALPGIALGIGGAWMLTRYLATLLYQVKPTAPGTFAALAGFLLITALAAAWLPARRAASVDPMQALRAE